ncbi:MAG: C4-type zinc ribbon domain-containing protein [Verrucomicrobiota bacterium]
MLPDLETLIRLQDRDQSVLRIQSILNRIPQEEEKAKSRLDHDLAAVESAKQALQENEIAIKNVEIEVQSKRDQIVKFKNQQLETKKNEAYQALGHEIERFTNDISDLETKELEFMEVTDTLKTNLADAQKNLDATQGLVDEELAALKERSTTAEDQLRAFEEERGAIAATVDEDTLDLYDRLLASKGDVAIVPLNDGKCDGCHMTVTTSTQLRVKADKEITLCELCSRMLYLPEE